MTWRTTPPGASLRSNTVTSTPARDRNAAAARPAGPAPITATFLSPTAFAGRRVGSTLSKPPRAAASLVWRMFTLSS